MVSAILLYCSSGKHSDLFIVTEAEGIVDVSHQSQSIGDTIALSIQRDSSGILDCIQSD